jgi:hypothetical protein
MQRRGMVLSETDKEILEGVFIREAPYRTWDNK